MRQPKKNRHMKRLTSRIFPKRPLQQASKAAQSCPILERRDNFACHPVKCARGSQQSSSAVCLCHGPKWLQTSESPISWYGMSGIVCDKRRVWTVIFINKLSHHPVHAYLQSLLGCCVQVALRSSLVVKLSQLCSQTKARPSLPYR